MKNKLMKQEIRETRKLIVYILAYMAVLSALTMLTAGVAESRHSTTASDLTVIFMLCSLMGVVVIAIVMAGRFYSLLFTDEGLIRLTLPVKNRVHLQTNVILGISVLYLAAILLCAMFGIMERDDTFFGLFGSYYEIYKEYYSGIMFEHVGLKAFLTAFGITISVATVIANYYITFVFALTLSRRIISKRGIMQKQGVIFIVGILLFNFQLLALWAVTGLADRIERALDVDLPGAVSVEPFSFIDMLRYDPEAYWLKDIFFSLLFIAVYGITAIVMYRISRNIMDRKLEV
ncbi:MAG: hypothetical protein V3G41_01660 [Lachnospiraceae bacterium]